MPHFETFRKSGVPLVKQPRMTIQKRGTITINAAAFVALDRPGAVELLYDPDEQVLGLRAVSSDLDHAAYVRPSSRNGRGPWVISAMAFLHHYEIDSSVARRWDVTLQDGVLCAPLGEPGEVVGKGGADRTTADPSAPRHRPRPGPRRR